MSWKLECVSKREIRKFEQILCQFKEETRRLSSAKSRVDDAEMTQKMPKLRIKEFLRHTLSYLPEAEKDLKALDGSQRILVLKAIKKVQQNPLPAEENGYGKSLGNYGSTVLAGLLKIKLRAVGLRVVYKLQRTESEMLVIVIGVRADEEVYDIAAKRAARHNLSD